MKQLYILSKMISRKITKVNLAHIKLYLHSVEKYYKTRPQFLRKNQHFFSQVNAFTKELTKELISQNVLSEIVS